MKRTILILIFLSLSTISFSQELLLKGKIFDSKTASPIVYCNIGVLNKDLGTLSNANGEFLLNFEKISEKDTILFSHLGYETIKIGFDKLKERLRKNDTLFLDSNTIILDEVKIKNYDFSKKMTFGYDFKHPRVSYEFIDFKSGSEICRYFENKNTLLIEKLIFQVNDNELKNLKLRVNFYDVKNGKPNNKLNDTDIFINTKHHKGRLKFDLTNYKLIIDTNFFVSLEAVDVQGNGVFLFGGEWYGGKVFYKRSSHDEWRINEPHSIAFRLKTKTESKK